MKSGHILPFLFCALACCAPAGAAPKADGHDILLLIPTPQEMIMPRFPARYRVPVTLSGDIAREITESLTQMKFDSPRFEEVMARKGQFSLMLRNEDYTRETQELVSGMLNPADMIDLVINSALKYRGGGLFALLKKETDVSVAPEGWNNRPSLRITLTPRGKRFGYSYEDRGAYVAESWLTKISVVMDSTSHLVYEMTSRKYGRRTAADQVQRPSADSALTRYVFAYDTIGGAAVPSRLDVIVNDSLAMVVSATYRSEGKNLVFASRSICYGAGSAENPCMVITYGKYDFSAGAVRATARQEGPAGTDLTEAARIADKAAGELKAGRIEAAARLLEKLAERYPRTPQAVQARKLLAGLPRGF